MTDTPETFPFTPTEYAERLARVRTRMAAAGIETLIVTDPSNMAWLTGYDGWSFYTHQAVLVQADGPPRWWGRGMDAAGARRTVWIPEDHIHGYPDHLVQNPDAHPMTHLCSLIDALGAHSARTGVEMDNYYFTAAAYRTILTHLGSDALTDATGLVNWCRAIKSPVEQTYMRRAAAIVSAMHARIRDMAEPGLPKNRLVAEICRTGIEGAGGHWGDYPAIVPMTPSGADASAPHVTWDDRPLRAGESTFFEIAGVYRRYHAPQSRTLFLGPVPDRYRRAEAAVVEATERALDVARPGATCGSIADAFKTALAGHGFEKDSRCGYAIGLSYPPDWGERTMSLRPGDMSILAPGMTFHFMPALWLDDGGLEISEPILITETGAERLCDTPGGLWQV